MRDPRVESRFIQPDSSYIAQLLIPQGLQSTPMNAVCTRWVHSAVNKKHSPINCVKYTPDGRRLFTGNSLGEITLWNSLTFNFETLQQAHDVAIRCMVWSHDGQWLVSCDKDGMHIYIYSLPISCVNSL